MERDSNRKFKFGNGKGIGFTIEAQLDDLRDGTYELKGPHGKEYRLEVTGVPAEYEEAARRLLSEEVHELNKEEMRALDRGRAVLTRGTEALAGSQGPIVRFDCTWVTWD